VHIASPCKIVQNYFCKLEFFHRRVPCHVCTSSPHRKMLEDMRLG
jgi:hypothetical protein